MTEIERLSPADVAALVLLNDHRWRHIKAQRFHIGEKTLSDLEARGLVTRYGRGRHRRFGFGPKCWRCPEDYKHCGHTTPRATSTDDPVCVCGHALDDHRNNGGECFDDDCDCIAFEKDVEGEAGECRVCRAPMTLPQATGQTCEDCERKASSIEGSE